MPTTTEAHCNHDAVAIRDGVCECGVTIGVRGGFDGFVLSFGEGCDDDSVNSVLKYAIDHDWCVRVTMRDGTRHDPVELGAVHWSETTDRALLKLTRYDEETGIAIGDPFDVEFDQVVEIHCF